MGTDKHFLAGPSIPSGGTARESRRPTEFGSTGIAKDVRKFTPEWVLESAAALVVNVLALRTLRNLRRC